MFGTTIKRAVLPSVWSGHSRNFATRIVAVSQLTFVLEKENLCSLSGHGTGGEASCRDGFVQLNRVWFRDLSLE